ncbi:hypothetical protein PsYK624_092190 [Phanerochaete sordida]|uniref:Uncharacterized protein n=1 Tax=Phanerochaete sordida TaxID=48140 RepID=A0A9P3GG15_9APHY|nr:hypothetical protein PsYK624_092190 [Phanerochaete sordida]
MPPISAAGARWRDAPSLSGRAHAGGHAAPARHAPSQGSPIVHPRKRTRRSRASAVRASWRLAALRGPTGAPALLLEAVSRRPRSRRKQLRWRRRDGHRAQRAASACRAAASVAARAKGAFSNAIACAHPASVDPPVPRTRRAAH